LVDRLPLDGHQVVVIDNFATGRRENLAAAGDAIRLVEGDVRDPAAVADAVGGCEVVFHQAALAAVARSIDDPAEVTDVNVGGTLNVLLQARDAGTRRVVFASSSSIYGDTPTLPKVESMPPRPRSPYAATKVAGEAYLQAFDASFGLEGVSLRYFNVYGPRQSPRSRYAAVVPLFLEAMSQGRSPTIYGDGEQTRDFSFVGDVVDAVVRAASAPGARGQVMNAGGGGRRVSILELASIIAREVGWEGEPVHEAPRAGDVRHSLADVTRAETLLGWHPSTTLEEGIRRLAASRAHSPGGAAR
ncbi:MAG: NAD-dependent epimerase/dehydratase family protein, partial [Planctomycetota bacterium]